MNNDVTAIVLAAGLGTRMKSSKAKVLHEAGGDNLLNHVIRAALHVAPAEQIVAVVGYQAEEVRARVKTPGIRFAVQHEQKGTGHAVLCSRDLLRSRTGVILILNGDGPLLRPETLRAPHCNSGREGRRRAALSPLRWATRRDMAESSGTRPAISPLS